MNLSIIKYLPELSSHQCEDESGEFLLVDIMVDGKLKKPADFYVGKIISCRSIFPYQFIAMEPKETQDSSDEVVRGGGDE